MEESGLDISALKSYVTGGRRFDWGCEFVIVVPKHAGTETVPINGRNDGENGRFGWMAVSDIDPNSWAWSCGRHAMRNFNDFASRA